MRFLADQDVYRVTIEELRLWGHEVHTARELDMQTATDEDLLDKARNLSAVLLTRDKDFGTLSFFKGLPSAGIIFLRCVPSNMDDVHRCLKRFLSDCDEGQIGTSFCVVGAHRYRIRRLV
jgi:predicted nuclease of predicted toxin-antitoxin system